MIRLYELAPEYARLIDAADDGDDVGAELERIGGELSAKVGALCHVIAELEAEAVALSNEEVRLLDRRVVRERRAAKLRDYLRENMRAAGIHQIRTATHTISLSPSTPRVEVDDVSAIPAEYMRQPPTPAAAPDKKAIADAYKRLGECVPGTHVVETVALKIK